MKFGICNEIFQDWKIEEAMEFAAGVGYNGMELAPFTLARTVNDISSNRRAAIRDAARRLGLEICGLHWLLARTEGLHLNHPDKTIRESTSRYLCDLVDCCADLGGTILVLGSPRQRDMLAGVSADQAWDWATATLREPVRRAEDRGTVWCFEPLGPTETNFINGAAEAIRFVRQFESPAAKIVLDVKAMCAEHSPVPEIIRASWPHFGHFHANDSNLKGPGFGEVDFRPIAATLGELGYDRYISVEVFSFEEGPNEIATRSLEYLRNSFAASGQE
jgi:sugar phosphate isomerase/epimerase